MKEKYIKYCTQCNKTLENENKFCKYCGKEAIIMPLKNKPIERLIVSELLYGPPYSAKYVCSNCGKVYIEKGLGSPDTRYCTECGTKFDICGEKLKTQKPMRYCNNCNKIFETEDQFCKYCGSRIIDKALPSWMRK